MATRPEDSTSGTCPECGRHFQQRTWHGGMPRKYCSDSCRQLAWRKRSGRAFQPTPRVCLGCGNEFVPVRDGHLHCSSRCYSQQKAVAAGREFRPRPYITDEVIREVHLRYPSTARDWDIEMVEACWDRIIDILPRRLHRLDAGRRPR